MLWKYSSATFHLLPRKKISGSLFEGFGTVERVNLILDRDTGRSRGFAFVGMPHEDEARAAIEALAGSELQGRALVGQPGAPARAAAEAQRLVGREFRSWKAAALGAGDMTRSELVARVADKVRLTNRQADGVVQLFMACVGEALRNGDKVELRGFGSFRTRNRKARRGRNPRTGEVVQVPAKRVPIFRVGQELRAKVRDAGS